MSDVAANVHIAVSGTLSTAPTGSTAPVDSTTALNVAFTDLGWIDENGVTEGHADTTTDIKGNDGSVIRRVITGSDMTLKAVLLEDKAAVNELYYKGSTIATAGTGEHKIDIKMAVGDIRSFVFDTLDGATHTRIYVATGEVTDRGDIVYAANGTPIGFEVTITCYPDANKVLATKFSDNAAWA